MRNFNIKEIKDIHSQVDKCYDSYVYMFQLRDNYKGELCVDLPKQINEKLAPASFLIFQIQGCLKK